MDAIPVIDDTPSGWTYQDSNSNTHIYRNTSWDHPEVVEVLVVYQGGEGMSTEGLIAIEYTDAHILIEDVQMVDSPSQINKRAVEMMEQAVSEVQEFVHD